MYTTHIKVCMQHVDFRGGSVVKNLPANVGDEGDVSSILGSGRSPGGGSGNPLQYSCLKKSHGQRNPQTTVHGVLKESDTAEQLSKHATYKRK